MKKVLMLMMVVASASLSFGQRSDDVPRFAVGTFSGYNDWQKLDFELTITGDNKITLIKRNDRGEVKDYQAYYRDGALRTGNTRYYLSAAGNGLRLDNTQTPKDSMTLKRGPLPTYRDNRNTGNNSNWSDYVGTFTGRNDNKKTDYTIEIRRDNTAMMTQRLGPTANSWKGFLRGDTLDFDWVSYRVRRSGDGIEIRNTRDNRESTTLRRTGGGGNGTWGNPGPLPGRYNLSITTPRGNERFTSRDVKISGTSNAPNVRVEITMPNGRTQTRTDGVDREGRWEVTFNRLEDGRYDGIVYSVRDGQNLSSQKMNFSVDTNNGNGNDSRIDLRVDNPSGRGDYRPGDIQFSGQSNADKVRIEIYRGRDRVYSGQVDVRDGRFNTKIYLSEGSYQATINAITRGRSTAERRMNINVKR